MSQIIDSKIFNSLYEGKCEVDVAKNSDYTVSMREQYTLYNRNTESILTLRLNLNSYERYYEWSNNNLIDSVIIKSEEADDFVDYFFYEKNNRLSQRPDCRGLFGFIRDNLKDIILVKITLISRSDGFNSVKIDYSDSIMPQ